MHSWRSYLNQDSVEWLLEQDETNLGIRYFALHDLLDRPETDPEVMQARQQVMVSGPVPAILNAQAPEGYWVKPGGGYTPSYRSTIWQIMFLAELGADPTDERVQRGCAYLLDHAIANNNGFSMGQRPVPSGVVHCLNGDLVGALLRLGYENDPRVQAAVEWQARAITGQQMVKYYRSATSGPNFGCGYNQHQPCAWGAVKAMRGMLATHPDRRSPLLQRAIQMGAEFLLSRDLAVADYPYSEQVSSSWFRFGFPLSYRSDVLEALQVLVLLGYGRDRRLANGIDLILSKQDSHGRWKMERSLNGKLWHDIEQKGAPSKWITLRALRLLKGIARPESEKSNEP
jgi:hypothetical protein